MFGADFGTVAFAFCNSRIQKYKGTYLRLFDRQSSVDGIETKEQWFFERKGLYITNQDRFTEIPSTGITYWFPDSLFEVFRCATIGDTGIASEGVKTGDNDRYLRLWHEVDGTKFSFATDKQGFKWYPHQKGGDYRKWYGNNDWIINWENDGFEIKNASNSGLQGKSMYFSPVICWPKITIRDTCFRLLPENSLFDSGTPALKIQREKFILGYLNSSVVKFLLAALNPTINCQVGDIKGLPLLFDGEESAIVEALVNEALSISKDEWNDYETSWEFISHPLINKGKYLIEDAWQQWKDSCSKRTSRLKEIEERINEEFIKLYGLGDVISPEVRGEDITLRQASVEKDIKSLISFAVGCMFGRFSLDDTGIAYAGGTWEKGCYKTFIPDEDNVIPITDEEYLEDDVISRFCTWLKVVFGDNTLEQNLDYIANALGNKGNSSREIIRNYFLNDFFKDHCQTYSVTGSGKRPIYWLFDSGKQNGFKALIYLHRYNVDTIGNLRIDYLHRMQRIYESEISRMQDMIDHSTNGREVAQATKRREKLTKQLKECREYDEKLAHLALSRIELDLDDGVKKNYRKIQTANDGKFYEVLADSKNIMSKK